MNTTGSLRTPASVIASWQSPRADAPSPNQPTATRFSSRMRNASAQPTATGSIAGRWLTIAISPSFESAMWTLPSRPLVGPSARPMYYAKIRHGSTPRTTWTPMSRCSLVPAARVERAGNLSLPVEDVPALLDPARQHHAAIDAEQVLAVEARVSH